MKKKPAPKAKLRDDQVMAQALCDWAISNKVPPKSLKTMVEKHLGTKYDYQPATNLGHMARGLWVGLNLRKPSAACRKLCEETYRYDFEKVFRTVFEGLSVSYSGYNSLPATTMLLRAPDALTRELARNYLRWDYTIQALCSTVHGRVVMPCGRVYARGGNGVYSAATDYRQRAIQATTHDGWWPPKGVGPKYWTSTDSVSARPWKEVPALPEMVFEIEERAALRSWVTRREITPELRALLEPIRVYQTLHVAPVDGGHVAWMESIQSYAAGDNTAQPLVWARGDDIEDAFICDPPTGCQYDDGIYHVGGVPVVGFPDPGRPHIEVGPDGPIYHH